MREKIDALLMELVKDGVLIAYSGGVDSALLLGLFVDLKFPRECYAAVTFDNGLYTSEEIVEAQKLANELGVRHMIISSKEIPQGMENNPENRCYICKKFLFGEARKLADELGFKHLIDGTNADDLSVYRPGKAALHELGVRSPLAECGIAKHEVREFASELGLSVWDKPSTPCLATRLPYGVALDFDVLNRISACEKKLKAMGFSAVRVRYHAPLVRLEVNEAMFEQVLLHRKEIVEVVKSEGFSYVTLDLEGLRSGSMDVFIEKK